MIGADTQATYKYALRWARRSRSASGAWQIELTRFCPNDRFARRPKILLYLVLPSTLSRATSWLTELT